MIASGLCEVARYQVLQDSWVQAWYEIPSGWPLVIVALMMGTAEFTLFESKRLYRKFLVLAYVCLVLFSCYTGFYAWFEILAGFYPFDAVDDCIPYRGNAPFAIIMTVFLYMIGVFHLIVMMKTKDR